MGASANSIGVVAAEGGGPLNPLILRRREKDDFRLSLAVGFGFAVFRECDHRPRAPPSTAPGTFALLRRRCLVFTVSIAIAEEETGSVDILIMLFAVDTVVSDSKTSGRMMACLQAHASVWRQSGLHGNWCSRGYKGWKGWGYCSQDE